MKINWFDFRIIKLNLRFELFLIGTFVNLQNISPALSFPLSATLHYICSLNYEFTKYQKLENFHYYSKLSLK